MDGKFGMGQLFSVLLCLLFLVVVGLFPKGGVAEGGNPGCWEYFNENSCIENCFCMWCERLGRDEGSCYFIESDDFIIGSSSSSSTTTTTTKSETFSPSRCISLAYDSYCERNEKRSIMTTLLIVTLIIIALPCTSGLYCYFFLTRRRQYTPVV